MGLFDIFKKASKHDRLAKKHSEVAVGYAKEFGKVFDYSQKSIDALEEILDHYSKDVIKSKPTENQIWSMSVIFGSYLGETMLKNGLGQKGFHWDTDGKSEIPLIANGHSYLTPIDKVYKRLVNGAEDNVTSFYRILIDIID